MLCKTPLNGKEFMILSFNHKFFIFIILVESIQKLNFNVIDKS